MSCDAATSTSCPNIGDHLLYIHHGTRLDRPHSGYNPVPCFVGTSGGYQLGAPQNATLTYSVPTPGCYLEYWEDPRTATVLAANYVSILQGSTNTYLKPKVTPQYSDDVVLLLKWLYSGQCQQSPLTASFLVNGTCASGTLCSCGINKPCAVNAGRSTGPISNYIWDWGDETPLTVSTGPTPPAHTYTANNTYVVTLQVTDSNPADAVFARARVKVTSNGPSPSLSASCNQLSCTFSSANSAGGDAPITTYGWNFGDANSDPNHAVTSHTYAGGGSYNVELTVTDSYGVMTTTTQTITVSGPPIPNFSANCSGRTCVFDASSTTSDSPITSYSWTFGDGGTGSGVGPTHAYAATGTYTVTLTVTDSNGETGTTSAPVATGLTAGFTFSCPTMTCSFYSTANGPATLATWTWSFGDGTVVTNPGTVYWDPIYTYAASGRYTVTLTVTDITGTTASASLVVLANLAPAAAPDSATTVRDTPVTIDVLANDSDPNGDPLTIPASCIREPLRGPESGFQTGRGRD
jgi:PKD repeat protein